jgi:hypothetical protein
MRWRRRSSWYSPTHDRLLRAAGTALVAAGAGVLIAALLPAGLFLDPQSSSFAVLVIERGIIALIATILAIAGWVLRGSGMRH